MLQDITIDVNKNLRQWTWQYCTEFGFFQTPSQTPVRSTKISLPFWPDYCKRIFGKELKTNTNNTNKLYGGTNIKGHNIFFANAEEDPWQWAGMRDYNPTRYPTLHAEMINCTDCGHCIDFHTPTETQPPELTAVQNKIAATINQWLADAAQAKEINNTEKEEIHFERIVERQSHQKNFFLK